MPQKFMNVWKNPSRTLKRFKGVICGSLRIIAKVHGRSKVVTGELVCLFAKLFIKFKDDDMHVIFPDEKSTIYEYSTADVPECYFPI